MRKIIELFSNKGMLMLALLVFVGPVVLLKGDPRIVSILAGIIFVISGVGQFLVSQREEKKFLRGFGKFLGVIFVLLGILMVVAAIFMFILGQSMQVSY